MKIKELAAEGFTGPEIHAQLWELYGKKQVHGDPPSLRTVQELMAAYVPVDPSGPWRVAAANPDEVKIILPLARDIFLRWNGKKRLTNREVDFILKIHSILPEEPFVAWSFAQSYVRCEENHLDTDLLDLALGMLPWHDYRYAYEYLEALGDEITSAMIETLPSVVLQSLKLVLEDRGEESKEKNEGGSG